ncbi:MAG: M48 family metallopeptidase [Deltaproteobacteria bacterium]|nr:M48 family metallopeptidase [Deltaproteobacteria bacterium]MBW2013936.1 M48 family metallopeptidase [Deltaproteobacteria bacterium]MBW2321240.1 M48 family metallopeptidase [Deltaproteobacteria bacterium]
MKTEAEKHIIEFGSRRIPYRLHRGDRKRLRIVVSPELTVDVFVPKTVNNDQVHLSVKKKASWIARTLDKLESYHPLPAPKRFISGETLVYLGRQYRLKVVKDSKQPAKLLGRFLWVWVEDKNDTQSIKKAVDQWYRKRANEYLKKYLEKCYMVASRHNVPEPLLVIRKMRRRWGSCSSKGRITLNVNLVQVPVHCIEYVIMHELCHLKHNNHSKAFYSLLTRFQPDWRKRKEVLDRFRLS